MTAGTEEVWNREYENDAPWDIGRPQRAFVRLAEAGAVRGDVFDAGCGTGTHALYLAERGRPVTGVDVSTRAIERAREGAGERGLDVAFRVGDLLDLDADLGPFDTVPDSGAFHGFDDREREEYVDSLAQVLRTGGRALVLAFSDEILDGRDDPPDDAGPLPNPVSPSDFAAAFDAGWRVREVRETAFETRGRPVPAYLAVAERV